MRLGAGHWEKSCSHSLQDITAIEQAVTAMAMDQAPPVTRKAASRRKLKPLQPLGRCWPWQGRLRLRSQRPRRCRAAEHREELANGEERRRYAEAEHSGTLVVDDKFELACLHDRQVRWLGALKDAAGTPTCRCASMHGGSKDWSMLTNTASGRSARPLAL
jgi:hypothetical protein